MDSIVHPAVHFSWASWYPRTMDTGWTSEANPNPDVSDVQRTLLIKSRTWWRFTLGSCRYYHAPEHGFWFFYVHGAPRLSLCGDW